MDHLYLWLKALHLISVISWMAGMLYLPRLYAYHAGMLPGSVASELFKVMERRLLRIIINPAMIATFIFGIWLTAHIGWDALRAEGWFHAKLTLVFLMVGYQALLSRWRRAFAEDRNTRSAKFYRLVGEIPTALMVAIVILVVLRPF